MGGGDPGKGKGAEPMGLLGRLLEQASGRQKAPPSNSREEDFGDSVNIDLDDKRFYREFIEKSSDAMFVIDLFGDFKFVNPRAVALMGYGREEILGKNISDFFSMEGVGKAVDFIGQAVSGAEVPPVEMVIRTLRGSRTGEFSGTLLKSGQWPVGILGIVRDITEHRRAEEKCRLLFDQNPFAFFLADDSGRILDSNETARGLFGYTAAEFRTMKREDVLASPPEDVRDAVSTRRAEGRLNKELLFRRSDGSTFPGEISIGTVAVDGGGTQLSIAVNDITERRRTEDALRESENRYLKLLSTVPQGISELDIAGNIVFANKSCGRIFGYDADEMCGMPLTDLSPTEGAKKSLKSFMKRHVEGSLPATPWAGRMSHRDGRDLFIEADWDYRRDRQGRIAGFSAVISDVTGKRMALTMVQESEKKFRSLAEESPSMIFIQRRKGMVYVNEQCVKVLGYSREDFYGGRFDYLSAIAPEDRERVSDFFQGLRTGRGAGHLECGLLGRDGRKIDVILAGKIIAYRRERAVLGIVTDITDRKRAEGALLESEEKYRRLMNNAGNAILLVDDGGEIFDGNKAAEKLTAYAREELVGMMFEGLQEMEDDTRAADIFREGGGKSGAKTVLDVALRRKDGSRVFADLTGTFFELADRNVGIAILQDSTERRRAEEGRQKLLGMHEREEIARWLHDHLGADLYNIILLVESITKKVGGTEKAVDEQLQWVSDTSREALASIRSYLDFSSRAGMTFEGLVAYMRDYGKSLLTPLDIGFTFEVKGGGEPLSLTGLNSFSVYLIFKEALTNILKHAGARNASVEMFLSGNRLTMRIDDDGRGLDAGESTAGHYGVTNIRARAEEMGGGLRILSLPENGTRVEFSIVL